MAAPPGRANAQVMPRRVVAVVAAGGAGPLAVGACWRRSALLVVAGVLVLALVVALAGAGPLGPRALAALVLMTDNITKVDAVAETRLRVKVKDTSVVDESLLTEAGVAGLAILGDGTLHLLAGLNADQYAAEMRGQLAAVPAPA